VVGKAKFSAESTLITDKQRQWHYQCRMISFVARTNCTSAFRPDMIEAKAAMMLRRVDRLLVRWQGGLVMSTDRRLFRHTLTCARGLPQNYGRNLTQKVGSAPVAGGRVEWTRG